MAVATLSETTVVNGQATTIAVRATDAATAAGQSAVHPERNYLIASFGLLIVGTVVGTIAFDNWASGITFTPPQGVGIFALFYILAQAIERLQEPFAPFIKGSSTGEGEQPKVNKLQAVASLEQAAAGSDPVLLANAKRTVDQVRANMTALLFGTAALVGMVGAGYMKSLLMRTVGVGGLTVWVDVLVTGLVLGGGTKGLHDLLSNIKESKEQKQDAAATT